jgi:hypothetical protein
MLVKFKEHAKAYGLGYQENEIVELDEKTEFDVKVFGVLLDAQGSAKGQAYMDRNYKIDDLVDLGIARKANQEEAQAFNKAKSAQPEKVKDGTFYYIHKDESSEEKTRKGSK